MGEEICVCSLGITASLISPMTAEEMWRFVCEAIMAPNTKPETKVVRVSLSTLNSKFL